VTAEKEYVMPSSVSMSKVLTVPKKRRIGDEGTKERGGRK